MARASLARVRAADGAVICERCEMVSSASEAVAVDPLRVLIPKQRVVGRIFRAPAGLPGTDAITLSMSVAAIPFALLQDQYLPRRPSLRS
jgi:hypothetical protein